jgi:hypothetical protein
MVEKPNFLVVPQLGHTVFPGNRANFRTFCSAGDNDMIYIENDVLKFTTVENVN